MFEKTQSLCVGEPIGVFFRCSVLNQALGITIPRFDRGYWAMTLPKLERLMNKDQLKGHAEEVKGKIKEATGVILDDESLKQDGNLEKNIGKVKSGFGDLKEDLKKRI